MLTNHRVLTITYLRTGVLTRLFSPCRRPKGLSTGKRYSSTISAWPWMASASTTWCYICNLHPCIWTSNLTCWQSSLICSKRSRKNRWVVVFLVQWLPPIPFFSSSLCASALLLFFFHYVYLNPQALYLFLLHYVFRYLTLFPQPRGYKWMHRSIFCTARVMHLALFTCSWRIWNARPLNALSFGYPWDSLPRITLICEPPHPPHSFLRKHDIWPQRIRLFASRLGSSASIYCMHHIDRWKFLLFKLTSQRKTKIASHH